MGGADGAAALVIDLGDHRLAAGEPSRVEPAEMDDEIAYPFLRVGDAKPRPALAADHPGIAHLPAAFGIERGLVENDGDLRPRLRLLDLGGAGAEGEHHPFCLLGAVAEELARPEPFVEFEPDALGRLLAGARPGGAGPGPLRRHRRLEARDIHAPPLLAQHIGGEVERKAIGVVETEGDLAGKRLAGGELRRLLGEQMETAVEEGAEAAFLELERLLDQRLGAAELGIGGAHLAHEDGDEAPEQRLLHSHAVGMPHGAAHDAAQHVAAPLIGGEHTIGDEEGGAAQMVGDDAVAHPVRPVWGLAGELGRGEDEGAQDVGVVIVVLALKDGGDALEPHAGVDRGFGKRAAHPGRILLILHEDEVPDLDEAVAIRIRASRRAARDLRAVVVEDLRAGAAGPGIAHPPEIVRGGDGDDPLRGQARDLAPEQSRLLVLGIDGDQEAICGEAELAGDEFPGELDGDVLEIVAEAEIAQHLEERVVAGGVADIVEVVVLAPGAHAFLGGGGAPVGPRLLAEEDVLELHHAAIGEEEARVVARHERRARHDGVIVAGEEVEKGGADVVAARHRGRKPRNCLKALA